jgi:hypothetical protein
LVAPVKGLRERQQLLFPLLDLVREHDAALELVLEVGVLLDPVDGYDEIGLVSQPVQKHGDAVGGLGDLHDIHRGPNGCPDGFTGHPEVLENPLLPCGRGPAVAAHGGNHKGSETEFLERRDHRAEDLREIGDATAAARDGHRLTRADAVREVHAGHLGLDLVTDVDRRGFFKSLFDADHVGQRHRRLSVSALCPWAQNLASKSRFLAYTLPHPSKQGE